MTTIEPPTARRRKPGRGGVRVTAARAAVAGAAFAAALAGGCRGNGSTGAHERAAAAASSTPLTAAASTTSTRSKPDEAPSARAASSAPANDGLDASAPEPPAAAPHEDRSTLARCYLGCLDLNRGKAIERKVLEHNCEERCVEICAKNCVTLASDGGPGTLTLEKRCERTCEKQLDSELANEGAAPPVRGASHGVPMVTPAPRR